MLEQNMLHRYMARKYILSLQVWETNFYSESITHISPQKTNGRPLIINMGGLKLHNPWNGRKHKGFVSGAPNENIVQNHLNIALLNVF